MVGVDEETEIEVYLGTVNQIKHRTLHIPELRIENNRNVSTTCFKFSFKVVYENDNFKKI